MISAPLPPGESERLRALARYSILDTPPEEGFDDLTLLAAQIFGTPTALVTLVDVHRQWFKSHFGLDASETPREIAFCAHAILGHEPLVIPDSLLDARFSDNPLVLGAPFIRFYAGTPLISPDGYALGTLCVIDRVPHSVSAQQLDALQRLGRQVVAQLELRRGRNLGLRALAANAEFMSTMSHEIRTPLGGVLGVTELLLDTALSPEQIELAVTVRDCGNHLLRVVDDVLDFSNLDSRKVILEHVDFDVREVVSRSTAMLQSLASAKGISLTAVCGPGLNRRMGDPTRMRQALLHLLGNAIKFTFVGGVTVCVDAVANSAAVMVSIIDTGIGIRADRRNGLFQQFSEADPGAARRFGGSGLGLAVTRRIVDLMGGEIGVTSHPGRGSTFWFCVPLPVAAPTDAVGGADSGSYVWPAALDGLRVLVADDNRVNQMLIGKQLQRLGCSITQVANGRAALQQWAMAPFDVILMDCQMPEMDGYEATRLIRADPSDRSQIPIIAFTANTQAIDREQCLLTGMSDFLSKPVIVEQLRDVLLRATTSRRADGISRRAAR